MDKPSMEGYLGKRDQKTEVYIHQPGSPGSVSVQTDALGHAGLMHTEGYSVLSKLAKFKTPSVSIRRPLAKEIKVHPDKRIL